MGAKLLTRGVRAAEQAKMRGDTPSKRCPVRPMNTAQWAGPRFPELCDGEQISGRMVVCADRIAQNGFPQAWHEPSSCFAGLHRQHG